MAKGKKIEHFLKYADENYGSISEADRGKVNIGEVDHDDLGKIGEVDHDDLGKNYATGAVMAKGTKPDQDGKIRGKIYDSTGKYVGGEIINGSFMSSEGFEIVSPGKTAEIDQNTSLLGIRDYKDNKNIYNILDAAEDEHVFDEMYKDVEIKEIKDKSSIKLITGEDVYINDSLADGEGVHINGDDLRGIIVTTKNVFICGKTSFKGAIVAKGNVMFIREGEKNITYDEGLVIDLISGDNVLYDAFYGGVGRTFEIVDVEESSTKFLGLGVKEEGKVKTVIANQGQVDIKSAFDDVMEFISWKEAD